jgi:hypothetical protein
MRSSTIILALIAVFAFVAVPSTQTGLNGDWTLNFNAPQGPIEAAASFKVEGEKVTGTVEGPTGSASLEGKVKGNTFTFTFEVQTQQGPMSIAIEGAVDGDALKGTFNFGQGTADFTGKRKTA